MDVRLIALSPMVLLKVSERLRRAVWTNVFSLVDALALLVSEFPHLKVLSNVFILEILALQGSEGRQREVLTHVFILEVLLSLALPRLLLTKVFSLVDALALLVSECPHLKVLSNVFILEILALQGSEGRQREVLTHVFILEVLLSLALPRLLLMVQVHVSFLVDVPVLLQVKSLDFRLAAEMCHPGERARHFPSLREGEALRRRSLMVSKALTNFARYPERRPVGITPAGDGSLNIDQLWVCWGRHLGLSCDQILQHVADHSIADNGRRWFLLHSDHEGHTWVTVAAPIVRPSRRFRRKPHRALIPLSS